MKKVFNIGILFFLVFGLLLGVGPTGASALSYDGSDPVSTGCANDAVTKSYSYIGDSHDNIYGKVELKWSAKCKTSWGKIKLYHAAPYDNGAYYANAVVYSYTSSGTYRTRYTCGSNGGNGAIMKGQTSCYTAQVYNGAGYKAKAKGYINWDIASGTTGWY
ncbi:MULTISPECIES: DUF2690 domain-containing protein [Priestia]|jgi:hypothetical protein|uniref:DUF2690 domain-containing protein n=1 Tax=Priestia megaterium TaxID=1404 RepID=A0AAE5P3I8_PRIMG|nr:DUF2690 domain-containing protein [Priestia megaterium]KRD81485.1 hypothetical protein ASE51_25105 [Bacillus sp. Root147]MCF6800051.1 YjfA family protein [Bacillus sp. ET1]MDD9784606.1 DUF2690 domain-containing protein [Priestia megaterium]MDR4222223.1 DUF2690 domain-containing protein [Priestia megaterium]MDR7207408.1 hypothetical protein [Priestia megaterium]